MRRIVGTLNAVARLQDWKNELRRTTRDLRTPFEKCTAFESAIFEYLLGTATILS